MIKYFKTSRTVFTRSSFKKRGPSCIDFRLDSTIQNLIQAEQYFRSVVLFPQSLAVNFFPLRPGYTWLTKFVLLYQKSRQNLSSPNFLFVNRGRNKNSKLFVNYQMLIMDIQIQQNLGLGIWLKRKLGCHDSCILCIQSADRPQVSQGTNEMTQ